MAAVNKHIFKQQNFLLGISLVFAWLLGNIWTFKWLFQSLKYTAPLNLIVLGIAFIVIFFKLRHNNFFRVESLTFGLKLAPVLLMLGGEIGAILLKWSINIPQLTLLCFILGSYGLLGLFINSVLWRKGLSVAIIFACIIPFAIAFNSGLGFPVRVLTAHVVAQTLADFHLGAVSSHDIIVMENGIAQVDLPCSGMKSLWTGTIFLLGATWLENRRLGWRWLGIAIANVSFLIIANVSRVLILVIAIEILQQRQIAEVLHLPLGVIGFIFASGLTWILLQKVPRNVADLSVTTEEKVYRKSRFNLLLVAVIILGIIGNINPIQNDKLALKEIALPDTIVTKPLTLTTAEANFFDNPANPYVEKLRFQTDDLSGSMLMVASDTWQAHHPPELCFMGNGLQIDKMNSQVINNKINARWLSLQQGQLSATYWFQSQRSTTDDFITRIGDYIAQRHKTWVLVSVLFDESENPDSREINNFTQSIYSAIDNSLNS